MPQGPMLSLQPCASRIPLRITSFDGLYEDIITMHLPSPTHPCIGIPPPWGSLDQHGHHGGTAMVRVGLPRDYQEYPMDLPQQCPP